MNNKIHSGEKKGYNVTIELNDYALSYDDVGEGDVPVIFLHGFLFDKSMWHVQLDALKTAHRVIGYDIRGFGKSTDEKSLLSIDLFAEDLIKFMDALTIDKAIICGLSMGGFIVLNAVKRFPDRFKAMILCDTRCIADTVEVTAKRLEAIEDIKKNGVNGYIDGFIKRLFHKDSFKNKKKLVDQLKTVVVANPQHIIINGLLALANRSETCSILPTIDIPTLILCGRQDEVTPLIQSEFMHENIRASVLHIIENAGHVSNLEQPEAFNHFLHDFLDDVSKEEVSYFTWDENHVYKPGN
jgi:pimeloyl-ACP methyl ester carboxylesterase